MKPATICFLFFWCLVLSAFHAHGDLHHLESSMVCIKPRVLLAGAGQKNIVQNGRRADMAASDLEFCYAVKYLYNYYEKFLLNADDMDHNLKTLKEIYTDCDEVLYAADDF